MSRRFGPLGVREVAGEQGLGTVSRDLAPWVHRCMGGYRRAAVDEVVMTPPDRPAVTPVKASDQPAELRGKPLNIHGHCHDHVLRDDPRYLSVSIDGNGVGHD